jgi:hypothetical protein
LSNSRFLKLLVGAPGAVRIQVTAPAGRDPDVYVYRRGALVGSGTTISNEDVRLTLSEAGIYLIEVLDCDNAGCAGPSPVPAVTDLTVRVTAN